MTEWRIGRGWTDAELEARLAELPDRPRNFSDPIEALTLERGWHRYFSEAVVARERAGPPEADGPFERGCTAVAGYAFSDPRIVIAHFDPATPLLGRLMLLELRALRVLHYLGAVVVGATRSEERDGQTAFGYRYDTLEGHIETGVEWFTLTKNHATGEVRFRIEAAWRPGPFPNWWSRVGFSWLGPSYQKKWHRRAHVFLARLMRVPAPEPPTSGDGRLAHTDPEVTFRRFRAHRG